MVLSVVTGPSVEPVTLAEARAFARLETIEDDAVLVTLIQAARARAEAITGRQLIRATYEGWLDAFESPQLELPRPPLIDIVLVSYVDTAGATIVLSSSLYQVQAPKGPFAAAGC